MQISFWWTEIWCRWFSVWLRPAISSMCLRLWSACVTRGDMCQVCLLTAVSCHGRGRNMEPLALNFAISAYHSGPYWAIMVPYVFKAVFYFKCFKYEPSPIREMGYIQYPCSEKLWDFGKVINNWYSFLFWYWPIHLFLFPQTLWTSAWVWLPTDMKRLRFLCWRASPACW